MLFPELEHAVPPNDFDPFRSESDAWKKENYERYYVNPRDIEIRKMTIMMQKQRRKSNNSLNNLYEGEELSKTNDDDDDERQEENASSTHHFEQYFLQHLKFFNSMEGRSSSSFEDESTVLDKLLNDSLWLSRFGSPFVEDEKNFFDEEEFKEI